ncbi:replication factor-A carboxy-terminal domain protein [Trifolium pratense]|uniref:Replication factor-A carboxy-terminal domain protein n=1 Tax=Trifolium pratense TaxID=57577 RepID=A0A2K3NNA8_TRIPR|nr:replication factor-A carboxy-terminal domain protein [Trifolium pratense]
MDSTFDMLCDVVPGRESWRVKVRVIRVWEVPNFLNPDQINSIEMVLIDEKGGKIHATIRKQLLYLFKNKISEGHVYKISYLAVAPNVMGIMTGISVEREYIKDGRVTKMIVVELTDKSGKCEIALFGDYVDILQKKMESNSEGLPVVAVQFAKVKIFRDKVSLQNVINTTQIFINPDFKEAVDLRNGNINVGIEHSGVVPVLGPRVTDLVDGQDWWYPACRCHKSVIADSGAYYCKGCVKHVFHMVPRFKVKFNVCDDTGDTIFVVFDTDMYSLIGKQCSDLVSAGKAENAGFYPSELKKLIGAKLLFKVEKSSSTNVLFDGSFKVKRVCNDSSILQIFNSPVSGISAAEIGKGSVESSGLVDDDDDDDDDDIEIVKETQLDGFVSGLLVSPGSELAPTNKQFAAGSAKRDLSTAFEDADVSNGAVPIKTLCVILRVVGLHDVQNFSKFCESKLDGTAVVCVCFFGVIEGVDMWFKEDNSQRFRLSLTGGDLTGEAAFKLNDEVVKQLVPETCKVLSSMVGGGSLYPQELDSFFGDPFLLKVQKKGRAESVTIESYEVLDVCADSLLVNFFIENYLFVCGDEVHIAEKNEVHVGSPLKDYNHIDDFDQLGFEVLDDEKKLAVVIANDDPNGKKRKLPEGFEVDEEISKVQKYKM